MQSAYSKQDHIDITEQENGMVMYIHYFSG